MKLIQRGTHQTIATDMPWEPVMGYSRAVRVGNTIVVTGTVGLLADETGQVLAEERGSGANLQTHGELEVEKVFDDVMEALAQVGYDVTLLDPSPAMLDKARQRRQRLPAEARRRVTLVQADGAPATYGWIPFGGGVRRCLGASFAEFEMRVVLETA